jgi:hypothetical protein
MANRRSEVYPVVHRWVVEVILIIALLHGAWKFVIWLWSDL